MNYKKDIPPVYQLSNQATTSYVVFLLGLKPFWVNSNLRSLGSITPILVESQVSKTSFKSMTSSMEREPVTYRPGQNQRRSFLMCRMRSLGPALDSLSGECPNFWEAVRFYGVFLVLKDSVCCFLGLGNFADIMICQIQFLIKFIERSYDVIHCMKINSVCICIIKVNKYQTQATTMLITPEFNLTQNDTHLILCIRLPYLNPTSSEFYVSSNTVIFSLKPYLLQLDFQMKLKQKQPDRVRYDRQKWKLVAQIQKQTHGEMFQGLALMSAFSRKKKKGKEYKPIVQVINSTGEENQTNTQTQPTNLSALDPYGYGFQQSYSNVFTDLIEEQAQLFFFDPLTIPACERYALSRQLLMSQFDMEAYLFDKYDNDEEISRIVSGNNLSIIRTHIISDREWSYEGWKGREKISKKQLLVGGQTQTHTHIFYQIVSIGYCYLYELLCMEGEFGVQSPRTINRTSSLFSCNTLGGEEGDIYWVLVDCARRCMAFSLYRHLSICNAVVMLLKEMPFKFVLKMLQELWLMFEKDQPRHLLNRIYIDDLIVWIAGKGQQVTKSLWEATISSIKLIITQQILSLRISQYQQGEEEQQQQEEEEKQQNQEKQEEKAPKIQEIASNELQELD